MREDTRPTSLSMLLERAHRGRFSYAMLMALILTAGLGPMLRAGELTPPRLISVYFILFLFPYIMWTCRLPSLLPPIFGFIYGCCHLFGASEITTRVMFSSFLLLGYGMMTTVVSRLPFNPKQIRPIIFALVFVGTIAALSAIYEDLTGFNWHTSEEIMVLLGVERSVGLHGNPSATAGFILLGLLSALFLWIKSTHSITTKILMLGILAVAVWGLYTTASRGAIVALFLALLPLVVGKRISFAKKCLVLLALIAIIANYQFLAKGRELSLTVDGASTRRMETMITNWNAFIRNPLTGTSPEHDFLDVGAHNNFLAVLATGGIVSFLPYFCLHWVVFLRFWRRRRDDTQVMLFCLFLVIAGLGLSHTTHNNIIFWCIIGLCLNNNIQSALGGNSRLAPRKIVGRRHDWCPATVERDGGM